MPEHRMFSAKITNSARFVLLPASARLLYYDLGMNADDEGIAEALLVIRINGTSRADLTALEDAGLVTVLNADLVTYVNDWLKNNMLRRDRIHRSVYHDLLTDTLPDAVTAWQPPDDGEEGPEGASGAPCPAGIAAGGEPGPPVTAKRRHHDAERGTEAEAESEAESESESEAEAEITARRKRRVMRSTGEPADGPAALMREFCAGDEALYSAAREWMGFRKKVRAPLTEGAARRAVAFLGKQPAGDRAAILLQSVDRGWKGLFPLETAGSRPQKSRYGKDYYDDQLKEAIRNADERNQGIPEDGFAMLYPLQAGDPALESF